MGLIIDTSVMISVEKKTMDFTKLKKYKNAAISVITVSELLVGVHRTKSEDLKLQRLAMVEYIIGLVPSIPFEDEDARIYALILSTLTQNGITIGVHDLMIGATAIRNGYPVLTTNNVDFDRIPGLTVIKP